MRAPVNLNKMQTAPSASELKYKIPVVADQQDTSQGAKGG